MSDDDSSLSLSAKFDRIFKEYNSIEETSLSTNDEGLQKRISEVILKLEDTTLIVSQVGLFSCNEGIEELSTSSLKFLLLPFLLGSLALKRCLSCREELLQVASIYFKDFIQRCYSYNITHTTTPLIEDERETAKEGEKESPTMPHTMTTQQDIEEMAKRREQKIKRYREKKQLEEKVKSLSKAVGNPSSCDEEMLRDYYLTMLQQFCHVSLEELDSMALERRMLKQMKFSKASPAKSEEPKISLRPLRPFLLTRNEAEKRVYGAGYPSLPTLSVEEFYEQRVKEGLFPANTPHKYGSNPSEHKSKADKVRDPQEEEDDDPEADSEKIAALRNRDEWRDTHRTGWGNTYNRS